MGAAGSLFGAEAKTGRVGEIIRRGGRGRYWQVDVIESDKLVRSAFVDGFDAAAQAVLLWLRGDDCDAVFETINSAIVTKPGERGWN